jgi:hypothetical protein
MFLIEGNNRGTVEGTPRPVFQSGRDEKGSDLSVGNLTARGKIRLMPDEHPTCFRIASEQPPIPVGTAVNLSHPNGHAEFCSILYPLQVRISPVKWKGLLGDAPRGLLLLRSSCVTSNANNLRRQNSAEFPGI